MVKTVINPMTTEEGVILVVEGSKAMELAIIVEIGAICLMSARRRWISVSIVE
ncbi:hypothetical protein A2U01_0071400, partial [Trifolium medium]|nr:hypothetical protein [Trifolium medium]